MAWANRRVWPVVGPDLEDRQVVGDLEKLGILLNQLACFGGKLAGGVAAAALPATPGHIDAAKPVVFRGVRIKAGIGGDGFPEPLQALEIVLEDFRGVRVSKATERSKQALTGGGNGDAFEGLQAAGYFARNGPLQHCPINERLLAVAFVEVEGFL